ncbi:MAG: biopolymer transporter ExbD [Paludibacteraceae bacterium]|nr:biopolymer transporter ExbD [Paludibacteraceae bacterium]
MAKKIPQINASSMADISFLLLIFFLVTTSMDVNQGLARRLPAPIPPDQKIEDTDINKRNLMVVKINSMNQLMVQGQLMDVRQLKEEAKKFIKNENDDSFYPKLYEEDFGAPIGIVKYTKEHVISVQNDVDTEYQAYLNVQNELVAAYNELRDECARKYFHVGYNELDEDNQKLIQKIYPQKISEAEPKNYGGN